MPMKDMEFFDPTDDDSSFDWQSTPGYDEGGEELVLYEDDGRQTRLLRLAPGTETDKVLTHDFYEEVYIIQGGLIDKRLDEAFSVGMYACRTPEMEHGPYKAPVGCMMIDFRYPG